MKALLRNFFDEKNYQTSLLVIVSAAFVLRLMPLVFFVDSPGDGPARAVGAYIWSRCPYIGIPDHRYLGFIYLAGIFSVPFDSPLFSARILNFILGTLTVPLFFLLIRRLYDDRTAILSSLFLACLPLHVGLSASSLTETSFLFELIAGTLFLIISIEKPQRRILYLTASLVCIVWATMTRFESWMFLPLFPAYYYVKTKSVKTTFAMVVVLGIFPLVWVAASYFHSGDLLSGYLSDAERGAAAVGQEAVSWPMSAVVIARMAVKNLGFVFAIAIGGLVWQVWRIAGRKTSAEQTLYTLMILLFWSFTFYFTAQRGWSLWNRYLLFGIVTLLPFISLPFVRYYRTRPNSESFVALFVAASIGIATYWDLPSVHLRPSQPTEIKNMAQWLARSPYRRDAVLLTKMDWQSTYLPLYFPELASCPSTRFRIVSFWSEDQELAKFVASKRPALLITRDGDARFQSRIESLLGAKMQTSDLVHRESRINAYDIRSYVDGWKNSAR